MAYLGNNSNTFDPTRTTAAPRDADRFSGNGSTVAFTLSRAVNKATDIEVFVENVQQEPLTAYDAVGTTLTFTGAPPSGTNNVYVVYRNFDSGAQVYVPDGSITYSKLANNIRIFTTDNLTPNGNNSVFTLSEPPADANTVFVTVDGVMQRAPVHYNTSGSTITFTSAPPAGSNVHVRHLGFRTSTTVTQLAANSFISQPNIASPTITGGTISAASITGNTAIPNGSQLLFNTGSVTFDVKPVTGASDTLQVRSTYSGNTYTGIKMDYLGRVNMPYQPAFSALGSGTQSWSGSSAIQVLNLAYLTGSIDSTRSSGYNTSTKRFTAPIAGVYAFYHGFTATSAVTGPESYLYLNGSGVYRMGAIGYTYTGGYHTTSSFEIMYLNVNDYVDVRIQNNNNVSMTLDLGRCFFGGYLIG